MEGDVKRSPQDRLASLLGGGEPVDGSVDEMEPDEIEATADEQEPEDDGEDTREKQDKGPQTFTVRVDGEEVTVTVDELLNGYSRTADYTRKTQALAEERKRQEAIERELGQKLNQYNTVLPQLEQMISEAMGPEPDWNALYQENPAEFVRQRAIWDDHRQKLQAAREERQRAQREQQQMREAQLQRYVTSERDVLLSKVPEWKDTDVMQREQKELREYATSLGYSAQEIDGLVDHRAVLVMRDALRYRQLQAKGQQVVRDGVKPAAPGTPNKGSIESKRVRDLRKRVKERGDERAAAALIEKMITGG